MSSTSIYSCERCSRDFHVQENLRFHYFCSVRTEQEKSADFGALFSLIPKCSQESEFERTIIKPNVLYRHLSDVNKFKEWLEDAKDLLIYKECDKTRKHLQTLAILDGLFALERLDSYVFNEGLFLLPELNDDRESVVWAFQQMLAMCIKTDSFIRNSQRHFLAVLGLSTYEQWIKEDFPHLDPEDVETQLPLERSFLRLGALLGELVTLIRIPVITKHPNPQDPDRYRKLTVEVEPFESIESSPLHESEIPPEF